MSTLVTIASGDLITNSRTDINNNFSALNTDKMETSVLDTDTTLAANSDSKVATQKAVKAYVDGGGTAASETTAGPVEEATDAEVAAFTASGTVAKLFITPAKISNIWSGFGDGSDGALTITSGTTTLAADKQYTSITISGTGVLDTAGYRVYVQGTVSVDASSGACIKNNGGAGGAGGVLTGGTAGAAAPGVTVPAGTAGKTGGAGRSTAGNGNAGTNGSGCSYALGVVGVAGGNGGAHSGGGRLAGAGGTAGTIATPTTNKLATIADTSPLINCTIAGTINPLTVSADSGGGGGGANDNVGSNSGSGGGSGSTGGCVFIAAKQITLTGSGAIQAKGGAGGNGSNSAAPAGLGGGGGGGGGAGGVVILIYHIKTGTGTIDVSGGAGGTQGTSTSDTAALPGTTGTTGKTYLIQV